MFNAPANLNWPLFFNCVAASATTASATSLTLRDLRPTFSATAEYAPVAVILPLLFLALPFMAAAFIALAFIAAGAFFIGRAIAAGIKRVAKKECLPVFC